MDTAINVSGIMPESAIAIGEQILAILNISHCDEKTKRKALEVLSKGVQSPQYTTISGCYFNNDLPPKEDNKNAESL